jgi:hypothetical protein
MVPKWGFREEVMLAVIVKGAVMGVVTLAVVGSFGDALIIASVSAIITGAFTVGAALLTLKFAQQQLEPMTEQVNDLHKQSAVDHVEDPA